jgi:hypothetical protein
MAPNTQNSTKSASAITTAEAELQPDERLIWAEHAGPGTIALRAIPGALIAIPMLAMPFFVIREVQTHWAVQKLGGLIFGGFIISLIFLVGLTVLLSPLSAARKARKTVYAITDQRLLIISNFPQKRVDSYAPVSINVLETVEGANGDGDIVFRKETTPPRVETGFLSVSVEFGTSKKIGFFGIPEVRKVEEAIRRLVSEGSHVAQ